MTVIAKAKRFTIRTYRKSDAPSLAKNINNKTINAALGNEVPYPYSLNDARSFIEKTMKEARRKKPDNLSFVIDIDGEVAGAVGFGSIAGHKAELGYWLAEKHWGRGITPEAVKLITRFGFNELGFHRVYARVFPFNKSSMLVLEKAGYSKEGYLRKEYMKNGKLMDSYIYAKVR
ncbi:MAG: GNAT family N-acetyltransferase [Actinobacteria bacterium]|nr:GNAT family N-acetyltransferase [Actinomycetota bacterium]MCG2794971.1 GNAT family N-acetyltransferase [Actinomycetes bacterium]MBU4240547.1 GNAT family N-acetyltransferase [Actinomycetota bacterium]MBU4302142.1 GNAT family N-acetyltransferase [Actinomycetota bacterium]MBU4386271.1 GNAT family N-acetyltransferase [Actinomycetota bacterium]